MPSVKGGIAVNIWNAQTGHYTKRPKAGEPLFQSIQRNGKNQMSQTYHIIKTYAPSLKEDLSGKAINKGKPDLERKQNPEN